MKQLVKIVGYVADAACHARIILINLAHHDPSGTSALSGNVEHF